MRRRGRLGEPHHRVVVQPSTHSETLRGSKKGVWQPWRATAMALTRGLRGSASHSQVPERRRLRREGAHRRDPQVNPASHPLRGHVGSP